MVMKEETAQKLTALAAALRSARDQRMGGYVSYIGGGASSIAGYSIIDELRQQVLRQVLSPETSADLNTERVNDTLSDRIWSSWGYGPKIATWDALHKKLRPTQ